MEEKSTFRWFVDRIADEMANKSHFMNVLTMGFALVYFYLVIAGQTIPERFETIVVMIISFYFGVKTGNGKSKC